MIQLTIRSVRFRIQKSSGTCLGDGGFSVCARCNRSEQKVRLAWAEVGLVSGRSEFIRFPQFSHFQRFKARHYLSLFPIFCLTYLDSRLRWQGLIYVTHLHSRHHSQVHVRLCPSQAPDISAHVIIYVTYIHTCDLHTHENRILFCDLPRLQTSQRRSYSAVSLSRHAITSGATQHTDPTHVLRRDKVLSVQPTWPENQKCFR